MHIHNLRVGEPDWARLRKLAAPSFGRNRPEVGAIGLVGHVTVRGQKEFLLAKVLWPQLGDIKEARDHALVFNSSYIRRAHLEMRDKKLTGLAFFHTHPLADRSVSFSNYDNMEEPKLVLNLQEIEPSTIVVSIVLGKQSQCGRVWVPGEKEKSLGRLISVGELLQEFLLDGKAPAIPPYP
jgi:hypothetical protein